MRVRRSGTRWLFSLSHLSRHHRKSLDSALQKDSTFCFTVWAINNQLGPSARSVHHKNLRLLARDARDVLLTIRSGIGAAAPIGAIWYLCLKK